MTSLKSATELAAAASKPYPNDSADYRAARTALLAEEIELRRHIERVAAQRRALPPGGLVADHEFRDENGKIVQWADLFGAHDTLVTYFWMYGPDRERPCPMCTAFIGSLDIPARDISQRVALAVIGRSPVERQLAFAREPRLEEPEVLRHGGRPLRARLPGPGTQRRRMARAGCLGPARRRGAALLGRRTRRHRRPGPGRARRARPHAAVEHPGPHAGRAWNRLVSQTGLRQRERKRKGQRRLMREASRRPSHRIAVQRIRLNHSTDRPADSSARIDAASASRPEISVSFFSTVRRELRVS